MNIKAYFAALLIIVAASLVGWAAEHDPIVILGNSDMTEANGVKAGSGTADDPYVISAWEIDARGGDYGVRVENVTAFFVLRGLVIQGATETDGAAIRLGFCANGVIEECAILSSINGIEITASTSITVRETALSLTGMGVQVVGDTVEEYRHTIESSTMLNGYPVLYYVGLNGDTIEARETTHLTVVDSHNVTVSANDVSSGDGILLAFVTDSTVIGNAAYRSTATVTQHGIHLVQSDRNEILENVVYNNRLAGIQLTLSSDNDVYANQFAVNDLGVRLLASSGNTVHQNWFRSNVGGVTLAGNSDGNLINDNVFEAIPQAVEPAQGILVESGSENRIERNGITDHEIGIVIEANATENVITANTIVNGAYGIELMGSYNVIDGNLISQQSRGLLFLETFAETTTEGNTVRDNVFCDNTASYVYTNLDSTGNRFSGNLFFGSATALIVDHGTDNVWTVDGVGNYWGDNTPADEDGSGIGDSAVTVYPSEAYDSAPLASANPKTVSVGVLGATEPGVVTIVLADGSQTEIPVLIADEGIERWTGFRGFPENLLTAGYPGILFSFGEEIESAFTMATVLFDLDIAFFDGSGAFLGATLMTAESEDAYTSSDAFAYALELAPGVFDAVGLGVGSVLLLP